MTEPPALERFQHDLPANALLQPESRDFLIALVLESGDRAELAWLARRFGREELKQFVRLRSGRKLSARSRHFWSRALGVEASPAHPLAEALWPLA
ncbi:MAG: hypothetical protein ABI639_12635 [Thermoanaerobaculia bacterium]